MTRREHKHAHEDVRGLMAELGDLVEDLGLKEGEGQDPSSPPRERAREPQLSAPPPPSAPVWRSGPEVLTGTGASALRRDVPVPEPVSLVAEPQPVPLIAKPEPEPLLLELPPEPEPEPELVAVPLWETAEPEPEPPAVDAGFAPAPAPEPEPPTEQSSTLWETFSPELAATPPRPWSPEAAMVVVEPAAPPGARPHATHPAKRAYPHAFTILTAVAVLIAAAIFTFSRLDLGHTTGPAQAVPHQAFALDTLRTVAASSPDRVAQAKTATTFPANAPAIYLDVAYRNLTASDALQIVILLQPQQSGQPTVTVSDQTHRDLNPNGEQVITVEAPPGGFTRGTYEVRALHDGTLEQSTTFTVS